MLQITLAPTSIAFKLFEQRRRRFLITAGQIERQPNFPPSSSHQRRFDEVVTQDFPPSGARPGNRARAQCLRKGSTRIIALCPQ